MACAEGPQVRSATPRSDQGVRSRKEGATDKKGLDKFRATLRVLSGWIGGEVLGFLSEGLWFRLGGRVSGPSLLLWGQNGFSEKSFSWQLSVGSVVDLTGGTPLWGSGSGSGRFGEVSGHVAGFVVTGLCLSRRTPHAHSCFQPGSSFCFSLQERYFLFDGFACLLLNTLIFKVLLLEFGQMFLCELHTPPPLFPGFRGQRSPPQRLVLRRSRNEPFSVTSYGARPSGRACLSITSWCTHSCRQ